MSQRPLAVPCGIAGAFMRGLALLFPLPLDASAAGLAKIGGFGVFLTATTVFGIRRPKHPPRHAVNRDAQDHVHPRIVAFPSLRVRG